MSNNPKTIAEIGLEETARERGQTIGEAAKEAKEGDSSDNEAMWDEAEKSLTQRDQEEGTNKE